MSRSLTHDAAHDAPAHATEDLRGRTVFLIGDYLRTHMAGLTRALLDQYGVQRVVLLTESDETAQEMLAAMREDSASGRLRALATHGMLENALARARAHFGDPQVVVCTPFRPLLRQVRTADGNIVLEAAPLEEVVVQQVMHHANVAQQLAQVEGARLTIVMPTAPGASSVAAALALTVRTMLRAFTAAMGAAAHHAPRALVPRQIELVSHPDYGQPIGSGEVNTAVRAFVTAALASNNPAEQSERGWSAARGAAISA
jgi:hypothetical protein